VEEKKRHWATHAKSSYNIKVYRRRLGKKGGMEKWNHVGSLRENRLKKRKRPSGH